MATYFVSETYLKENTPFNGNLDINLIRPFISLAQDLHVQVILGTNFYNHLWTAYSGQTLTSDEQTLVEKIQPALAYRAAEMSLEFMSGQITNKGPQQFDGDFSRPVDSASFYSLKNDLKNWAEFYEQRLVSYLAMSGSAYSEYEENNDDDILPDGSSQYDVGITFYD